MKIFKICILFLALFQIQQFGIVRADVLEFENALDQPQKGLDIYLVIGQSNMAGRAVIRDVDTTSIEGSYLFTGDTLNPWVSTTNPLNRYSSVRKEISMQRLGPSYAFAQSMSAEPSTNEIGLVVNAKGGTKIVQWLPGTDLYQAAINQTHKALKFGKLKGIIWHQGESDWHPIRVDIYLGRLEILINALREEFDDPSLPFVAGQLYENGNRQAFNEMILQLPNFISNTGVVTSEGTNSPDGTHFDSESAILLGNRYAIEMKKVQSELSKTK